MKQITLPYLYQIEDVERVVKEMNNWIVEGISLSAKQQSNFARITINYDERKHTEQYAKDYVFYNLILNYMCYLRQC